MTHDELLEKIERERKFLQQYIDGEGFVVIHALRAVVELHKPISSWVYEEFVENHRCSCDEWNEYDMGWPCDTIQAIEKELN